MTKMNDSHTSSARAIRRSSSYFGSRTEIGLVRQHNEDSLIVVPPLFAVADGMGGHEAGEVASEIVVSTLAELAPAHPDAEALTRAVEAANLNVLRAPSQGIGREGMGTTLTAAMLEGERLLIAQVGDSRAYLLHQGSLQQITRDHSLMADMIEAGHLTPEEARVHPNRSVITRAIGSDTHLLPDIYELNVDAGDRLLLCSDGLNAMVEDSDIENIMRRTQDPQKCASNLVDAALQNGGVDNVTVVVVDVQGFAKVREKKTARRSRALFTVLLCALVALFALAGFGGYHYLSHSAYLAEENGKVAVYTGVPDSVFGMNFSALDHVSDVNVDDLQPGVANRIRQGMQVDNLDEANRLIEEYKNSIAAAQNDPYANSTSTGESTTENENASANNEVGESGVSE